MAARSASARRKPRQPIDWRRAAELLVENMPIGEVAREIGCSRSAISRRRNHDPIFQGWMQRLRDAHTSDPEERVAELRRSLHAAIVDQIGKGNARIILWLAERLNLVPAPGAPTPVEELRGLLGNLSADELAEFENLRDPA
jgi:hypothetical protein